MKQTSLIEGNIFSSLVRFALPVLFTLFLQALYGAVDLLVVGQFAQTAKKKSPAFAEPFPTKIIFIRQSFWETGKLFKGRWWRHRAPFLCLYYMPPGGRIPPF